MPPQRNDGHRDSEFVRVHGRDMPVRWRIRIGRREYFVLDELGTRGRKRYMAFDKDVGPRGALRALLILPTGRAAWQHARILDQISTRNGFLPKVLDFRQVRRELYIAMEWVNGIDLQHYLNEARAGRRASPSVFESVRLIRRLAHDLGHVHRKRGVVHGDINPRNLIVASEPTRLVPVDFGSAWQFELTARRDPGDGTSPAYAAPELAAPGREFVTSRCDQFSCGVVLYEMLTLVVPYEGLGGRAATFGMSPGDLIPTSSIHLDRGRIPRRALERIDAFIARSLQLDADRRFPTVQAWLDGIDRVYESLRTRHVMSPVNTALTRVIEWVTARWCRM